MMTIFTRPLLPFESFLGKPTSIAHPDFYRDKSNEFTHQPIPKAFGMQKNAIFPLRILIIGSKINLLP